MDHPPLDWVGACHHKNGCCIVGLVYVSGAQVLCSVSDNCDAVRGGDICAGDAVAGLESVSVRSAAVDGIFRARSGCRFFPFLLLSRTDPEGTSPCLKKLCWQLHAAL